MDQIVFTITWQPGNVPARLERLRLNDVLVTEPRVERPGAVSVSFTRARSDVHHFRWTLLFASATLRDLKAVATVNGESFPVQALDEPKEDSWVDEGVAS